MIAVGQAVEIINAIGSNIRSLAEPLIALMGAYGLYLLRQQQLSATRTAEENEKSKAAYEIELRRRRDAEEEVARRVSEVKTQAEEAAVKVEEVRGTTKEAAKKVEQVKTTLESTSEATAKTLSGLVKVGLATHTLVNSEKGILLRENAQLKREKAILTGIAADISIAEQAEQDYTDHQAKQALVDDQPGTDDEKSGR